MTDKPFSLPVLYILMRNDMASMNAGKAIAQGSHASNAFLSNASDLERRRETGDWETATSQGFGTVLVLEGGIADIEQTVNEMQKTGYIAGMVFDPTYPIRDGDVIHYIPIHTCGYVFIPDKNTTVNPLARFNLHV